MVNVETRQHKNTQSTNRESFFINSNIKFTVENTVMDDDSLGETPRHLEEGETFHRNTITFGEPDHYYSDEEECITYVYSSKSNIVL